MEVALSGSRPLYTSAKSLCSAASRGCNTPLPAFDSERRAASPYFRSPVAGDGAVSELLLRCFNGTVRRTDIVPLHRSVRAVPVDFCVTCTGVPVPRCRPMMHVGRGICGTGLQVRVNVVCLPAPANQSHSTAARHSQPHNSKPRSKSICIAHESRFKSHNALRFLGPEKCVFRCCLNCP